MKFSTILKINISMFLDLGADTPGLEQMVMIPKKHSRLWLSSVWSLVRHVELTSVGRKVTLGPPVDGGAACPAVKLWVHSGALYLSRVYAHILGIELLPAHTLTLKVVLGAWGRSLLVTGQECLCAGPGGTAPEARFTSILFK